MLKIIVPILAVAAVIAILLYVPAGTEKRFTCTLCRANKETGSLASAGVYETSFTRYYNRIIQNPHEHQWGPSRGCYSGLNMLGYLFGPRTFGGLGSAAIICNMGHPISHVSPDRQVTLFESLPPEYHNVVLSTLAQPINFVDDMDLYRRLEQFVKALDRDYPCNDTINARTSWLAEHTNSVMGPALHDQR